MSFRVFDFFCGCGGTSAGLQAAGMEIILGIDCDADAQATFEHSFPKASFIPKDIRLVKFKEISPLLRNQPGDKVVFCGCAPCQPFTKVNTTSKKRDKRVELLSQFGRFVKRFKPNYVIIENVPGLQKHKRLKGPFPRFLQLLSTLEYEVKYDTVSCHHYGVPQTRKRLILIATLAGQAPWPVKTHGPGTAHERYATVWDYIRWLPPIKAGEEHAGVANHRAAALSKTNLERIKHSKPGKGRECWPKKLRLPCYEDYKGHTDVYGRLRKDRPAAALTTRCISLSNGRFGHPVQNRAISVREAACLQTFERDFVFKGSLNSMARQIGNAVPVLLAKQIGIAIIEHSKVSKEP